MHERSRRRDRRAGHRLALLLACAVAVLLGGAGPALAAPGLTPLGRTQIGLPTGQQLVGAVVVHRGAAYALVIERTGPSAMLELRRFDESERTWLPVAGPLNHVNSTWIQRVSLLSTRAGELYAAWTEGDSQAGSWRAMVARLRPDGRGWERVMQTPIRGPGQVRLAQVGNQVLAAWDRDGDRVRLARITRGGVEALPTEALPAGVGLADLVGYGAAAYISYREHVHVPAHRDNETGLLIPADIFERLRVARLAPVADGAGVRLTEIGSWNDAEHTFLTAGTPDAPARPILAWRSPQGIEVMRLRADGNGFDRIPVAPLITLRRIGGLRGLAATPAGITIAATSETDESVRVYTLAGTPDHLTITNGDPLPHATVYYDDVAMVPTPRDDDPGALVLGYNQASPMRAAAMRYSP